MLLNKDIIHEIYKMIDSTGRSAKDIDDKELARLYHIAIKQKQIGGE